MKENNGAKELIAMFAETAKTVADNAKESQKEHPLEVDLEEAKVYTIKSIDGTFKIIKYPNHMEVFHRYIGPNDMYPRLIPFDSDLARLWGFDEAIENYERV